ncbi:MAG: DUF72 domain-containing protein [Sphingomicrobium sp.]
MTEGVMQVRVGTAGWSIGPAAASSFPAEGSGLERYSSVLPVTEINSSFHRPHRLGTWERWRDAVPETFRFSVKIPKTVSHERKLVDCDDLLGDFLTQTEVLGEKLAILLLQLPPKLEFHRETVIAFLEGLARRCPARIVVEPRHLSWFGEEQEALLRDMRVARVAADPAICPSAALPGGWPGLHYWRLHGSPERYRSSYADRISEYVAAIGSAEGPTAERWCIFDNTASSAATGDAVNLQRFLSRGPDSVRLGPP